MARVLVVRGWRDHEVARLNALVQGGIHSLPGRVQIISLCARHVERRLQDLEWKSELPACTLELAPPTLTIAAPAQRDGEVGHLMASLQQRQERRSSAEDLVVRMRGEMEHAHLANVTRRRCRRPFDAASRNDEGNVSENPRSCR
ncbi:MAG TPA: hypothetical protein VHJ54_05375 [Solirubrobacterales bacterium]|nr:hypothetical protein [Solirubrobacterales bacterium]